MDRTKSNEVWDHLNIHDDMVVCKKFYQLKTAKSSKLCANWGHFYVLHTF